MIIIEGRQIENGDLERGYAPNSTERIILNTLLSSQEKYVYDSADQLKFEILLRNEIVKAAKELNNSGMSFEIFRESKCNPKFWIRTNEGGFKLKEGVRSSDAIADIFTNGSLYGTECATAMIIVYYKALLNIFPKEAFDRLFPKIHLMNWHYIDRLLKSTGSMRKEKDYLPGDRRYFANPDVNPTTPEWQGENAIDLNSVLYYGHGVGIFNSETIIKLLNENRIENPKRSAYLMEGAGRPDFKEFYGIYRNLMGL